MVNAGTIPVKTPQGQAELTTRQRRLSQRHRTVLFLVDGKRSAGEVTGMALQAGVPQSCFSDLVDMGLIMLAEPSIALWIGGSAAQGTAPAGSAAPVADAFHSTQNSTLPPSRTLYPESGLTDSGPRDLTAEDVWFPTQGDDAGASDPGFVEAQTIMIREVRAQAPLTGSLTLMRLRRARTRADLSRLLEEVETRITKPHRSLAASQTMRRGRQVLERRVDSWSDARPT